MLTLTELPRVSFEQLAQFDATRTTILTVNNRLARRMTQDLARQAVREGGAAELPSVVPWSGWIAQQLTQSGFHENVHPHSLVLDTFGSQLLWGQIIEEIEATTPLLDTQQAAAAVQQADKLLDEWMIEVEPSSVTEEYAHFIVWREQYREQLQRLNALDPNLAIDRVIEHVGQDLPVPEQLLLVGFSELTPRMSCLLEALRARNVSIALLEQEVPEQAQLVRVVSETAQTEWEAAAFWARDKLEQNPEGRFAIVAVSLEADAAFARRTLSRILAPSTSTAELPPKKFSYNVAVARALSEWQAGRAVLAWLRTFVLMKERGRARASDLGAALLSGYCAGDLSELGARANIDARWRRNQLTELSLAGWSKSLEGLEQLLPAWHLAWQAWADLPRRETLDFWSAVFRQSLATLGFPGRSRQSSTVYQVIEALDDLFERFDALSPVLSQVSASEALGVFGRLMRGVAFQPQRDPDARLDVLGMLEAEGGRWDAVWILGLTDEVFPAVARPNPFIPLSALRRAGAPRATPEREREWAGQMFAHLCALAPNVVLSSAMHEGERGLRPSPLISHVPLSEFMQTGEAPSFAPSPLESLEDLKAPALGAEEQVSGGVSLLELQARNPLWAFVRYRLGASGLLAYSDLPSNALRGEFLHDTMEVLWKELRSQTALRHAASTDALDAMITRAVQFSAEKNLSGMRPALRALEEKRAVSIVSAWLVTELERLPFVVVDAEEKYTLSVAGLKLNVRLDRMDQLEDGRAVVIDYKGGKNLPKVLTDWQKIRPVSLQLPAYASVLAQRDALDSIAGLMLVHLHSKAKPPVGLLREEIGLKGPTLFQDANYPDADWTAAMQRLNASIEKLAVEFTSGVAINQSWSKSDLEYCDVQALLRIFDDETHLLEDDSDADASNPFGDLNGD